MRLLALGILFVASLSGCIDAGQEFYGFDPDEHYSNPGVFVGDYQQDASVLTFGNLTAPDEPEVVYLESTLPHYGPAGGALSDSAIAEPTDINSKVLIPIAVWIPENRTGPVPVIVDAGPYFEQDCKTPEPGPCPPAAWTRISDPQQSTGFSLRNFLAHGYAVAQVAVRGTGTAGGCMDLLGPSEQNDLVQAIEWLGTQEWSNGNIGMIGVSYDGSTPWLVAASGSPYLKTIVPTSGLPDIYDLMFHNGSAETRGAIMHNNVYYGFGFSDGWMQEVRDVLPVWPLGSPDANGRAAYQDNQNLLCDEVIEGTAMGQYTQASGDRGDEFSTYWAERDYRQRVLDNYKGSVFLIHGLQDWNVDPHAAIPFNQQLRDAGIEMKEWYGQWGHDTPNGECGGAPPPWAVTACRVDYGEVLRRWFDHYLKDGTDEDLGPSIQVQDNLGYWRNADSFPARDADWASWQLSADGRLGGDSEGAFELPATASGGPAAVLQLESEPLQEELHFSGLAQLKLPFSVDTQGGHIAAWLFDLDADGQARAAKPWCVPRPGAPDQCDWKPSGVPLIAHAQMNLLYHAGGEDMGTLTPGERYVAQIEFEAAEVRVPAGNRLGLWVFQYQYPDHRASDTRSPVVVYLDEEAQLRLPVVDVDPRTVFPVPTVNFLNHTYVEQMYVQLPTVPAAGPVIPNTGAQAVTGGVATASGGAPHALRTGVV